MRKEATNTPLKKTSPLLRKRSQPNDDNSIERQGMGLEKVKPAQKAAQSAQCSPSL